MTSGNNKHRETGNDKRHINLTVDDVPDGSISNPIESSNYPKSYKSSDTDAPPTIRPLIAMTTSVTIRNRADNCTNILQLAVQNRKGGLGRSPRTKHHKDFIRKLMNLINDKQVYQHILNVLLDGNNNTQIGIAIRESAPTLRVLLEYIRTPGLIIGLRWKDKDDGNKEKMLTKEQYEDLFALNSFFCSLQNGFGPITDGLFNILATTRAQFEDFIVWQVYRYSSFKPIHYNQDEALKSQQRLLDDLKRGKSIVPWYKTDTTPVYGNNSDLWSNYFDPPTDRGIATTQGIRHSSEFYILSSHELYWNEISIWPPRSRHERAGNMYGYMKRVLSGQLSTIYGIKPHVHNLTSNDKESQTDLLSDGSTNVMNKGGDINGKLSSTNSGEGSGVSTTEGDAMEGRINVVSSGVEEVKLLGGGRSDPNICSGDSSLESPDTTRSLGGGKGNGSSNGDTTTGTDNNSGNTLSAKNDPNLDVIRKAKRTHGKMNRRSLSRQFTGSGRRYHEAVPKMQPSVIIIQRYTRMFLARKKVRSLRVGSSRRGRRNGRTVGSYGSRTVEACTPATPLSSQYTLTGTRRIPAQATGLSQPSLHIKLLSKKNGGENGEMAYVQDTSSTSANVSANVFAISVHSQVIHGSSPLPKALYLWGEESNGKYYIRLDGEYVRKVEVDLGAWGEYDDNPIGVSEWNRTMTDVWGFTGQVSTIYNMYTLVSITLVYIVMVEGIPKTGVVLYRPDVRTISDELRVSLQPKVDYHDDNDDSLPDPRWSVEMAGTSTKTHDPQVTPSHVYRWGESTNLICFAMSNDSLIKTPQAASDDILLSPCSGRKCAGIVCILLHQWKGQPIRCVEKVLELHRHEEDVIWGACEHDGRPIVRKFSDRAFVWNHLGRHHLLQREHRINLGSIANACSNIDLNDFLDTTSRYTTRDDNYMVGINSRALYRQYDTLISDGSNTNKDHFDALVIDYKGVRGWGAINVGQVDRLYSVKTTTLSCMASCLYLASCLYWNDNEKELMALALINGQEISCPDYSCDGDNSNANFENNIMPQCTRYISDTSNGNRSSPNVESNDIGIGIDSTVFYTNDLNCETFEWEMTKMTYLQVQRRSLSTLQWKLIPKICIIILNDNDRGVTTKKQNKHPICKGIPIVKVGIFVLLRDDSETVVSPRLHQQLMSLL